MNIENRFNRRVSVKENETGITGITTTTTDMETDIGALSRDQIKMASQSVIRENAVHLPIKS